MYFSVLFPSALHSACVGTGLVRCLALRGGGDVQVLLVAQRATRACTACLRSSIRRWSFGRCSGGSACKRCRTNPRCVPTQLFQIVLWSRVLVRLHANATASALLRSCKRGAPCNFVLACVLLACASRGGGLRGTDNGSQAKTHALQSLRRCLADGCSGTCSWMGHLVVSDVIVVFWICLLPIIAQVGN